ncbi:hypothetical protein FA15DRAFT_710736 [Coprinopsis marcescibilis]|uniref:Uncharacterized protein n=1 Tax=Coprinopsis marcescibilis TaxID=230819 RepID=A0A5C3KBX4_COPMA|nr:hypothetical protein FA15DRAFT_710736 [Coprinopsis marcescibilis]
MLQRPTATDAGLSQPLLNYSEGVYHIDSPTEPSALSAASATMTPEKKACVDKSTLSVKSNVENWRAQCKTDGIASTVHTDSANRSDGDASVALSYIEDSQDPDSDLLVPETQAAECSTQPDPFQSFSSTTTMQQSRDTLYGFKMNIGAHAAAPNVMPLPTSKRKSKTSLESQNRK